ncbi:amidophosphoribosyltransferase [Botrimarina mediterranea]|uniref:Amidophosphoribosyltransferase n=1 Tax=Botrimarina mediterranea TaxID=2528022 RepID=A0A518KD21_9BACT|nr:amidophosphoribosyltransferase [Botrimarina mediterranea]QDV75685.1 Amidophosphoribosyltransferase [Botrimarina mediterranea]QDV80321.1 Amidophosphoribosyltransferase [Planctomycetes bacterium K2D]
MPVEDDASLHEVGPYEDGLQDDGPRHECGIAALYHLPGATSPLCPPQGPGEVSRLLPRMLLDIQNRGQLSTGMTTWAPGRDLLLETYKELGGVSEAFRLSHRGKAEALMARYAGRAAIGHVRYATCGKDDINFAQPFEHRHLQKRKWFAFGFNGQLANYGALREEILSKDEHHVALKSDTEILMHELARQRSSEHLPPGAPQPSLIDVMRGVGKRLDGAYSIALLNAEGEMLVARDPLGMKPVAWGLQDNLFAAASESVALLNLGFEQENIHALGAGEAITIADGPDGHKELKIEQYAPSPRLAHCFFEWVYFANVASSLDDRSVYLARKALGEELASIETLPIDADTVVVPVPDTSKAAADAMAYKLGVPSVEGLMRNRYSGRTFIEGGDARWAKVTSKYTPLREVLEGKKVILVEDSIVRSTTMRALIGRLRDVGRVREIHVRVACPPIVAPCFYGIDMSTVGELFAPPFVSEGQDPESAYAAMAAELGADSLRYLPVESIARAIQKPASDLCRACVTGDYPTAEGQRLYQIALDQVTSGAGETRTYEGAGV